MTMTTTTATTTSPTLAEQWTRPRRARAHFPPYELIDRDLVAATEERTRKLARLYHVAH
jgi:hypothetical protein